MLQRPEINLSLISFHQLFANDSPAPDETDTDLEDAARTERDYVRQRLVEELGREPSEEEVDEWLRQHTEGY